MCVCVFFFFFFLDVVGRKNLTKERKVKGRDTKERNRKLRVIKFRDMGEIQYYNIII